MWTFKIQTVQTISICDKSLLRYFLFCLIEEYLYKFICTIVAMNNNNRGGGCILGIAAEIKYLLSYRRLGAKGSYLALVNK